MVVPFRTQNATQFVLFTVLPCETLEQFKLAPDLKPIPIKTSRLGKRLPGSHNGNINLR